jgi:acyl dehydratase
VIDRKFIGLESEDRFVDVEKGQLRLFATATAEQNPIYFSEEAAKEAGYPAIPAPPTFAFCLASLAPAKNTSARGLNIPIAKILHGEQQFVYHKQIFAGDRIRLKTRVADIYEKKGGALEFIVFETTSHNQANELCVSARTVTVVRN